MIVDVQNKLIRKKGGLADIGIPFPLDDVGKDFFYQPAVQQQSGHLRAGEGDALIMALDFLNGLRPMVKDSLQFVQRLRELGQIRIPPFSRSTAKTLSQFLAPYY